MTTIRAALSNTIITALNLVDRTVQTVDKTVDLGFMHVEAQHRETQLTVTDKYKISAAQTLRESQKVLKEDAELQDIFDKISEDW